MKRVSLNCNWEFAKLPNGKKEYAADQLWETVSLPHTWYEPEESYRGLTVYRKTVSVDPTWPGVILEFEGADQSCFVFVNGTQIGQHKGAYARFRFAVPVAEVKTGELEIAVFLDNSLNPDVSPNAGDFTIFGGLYRHVNMLIVGNDHFDYCYYGTDGIIAYTDVTPEGNGVLRMEPHVCTSDPNACILYSLEAPNGENIMQSMSSAHDAVQMAVPEPLLWNGKRDPKLYTLKAYLQVNGKTADETEIRLGFRKISIDPNTGLELNGCPLKIRGVAKHQDRAGVYSAVTDDHIDEDFSLIREIGANALRLSHYQHGQHTYQCCDEGGYLVWAEIPMLKMTESHALFQNAEEQLRELILQNIHHPSIFCWGIQNEIGIYADAPFMYEKCRSLTALAKRIDNSRLVTAANLYNVKFASELNAVTDMIGYNLYFGWYYGQMQDYSAYLDSFHETRPEMPLGISEYGVDANPALHSEHPKVKDYSEEYQALYHETVYPCFQSKNYLWGSFVWNMFDFSSDIRDEGGVKHINSKGMVNYDRSIKKDAFYYYKAIWSEEPFVHLCSRRFINRCRKAIDVKIYTNQPCATLFVNEAELGTLQNNGNGTICFSDVVLSPGKNTIRAVAGTCEDECLFSQGEEDPSYALPDQGEGMVRNWFEKDDDTVRTGYYSIMDTAGDILAGARPVMMAILPELVEYLEQGNVPLGLFMKDILAYALKDNNELIIQINHALNQVKKADKITSTR